jgi:large subunit ribosomal protein L7/L12
MSDAETRIQALELKVGALERQLAWAFQQLKLEYTEAPAVHPAIADLLARGDLIEAIKLYRLQTGAGLAQAKDAVEAIQATLKSGKPFR